MKRMVNSMYHASFLSVKEKLGDKFPSQDVFYIVKLSGLHKTKNGEYKYMNKYEVVTDRRQICKSTLKKLGFDITKTVREYTLFIVDRVSRTAKAPEMTHAIHNYEGV